MAWSWQVNRDFFEDPAWCRRHDQHSISEQDRFVYVMGYKG